ncbi:Uncharacterized protein FWK35_00004538, partial [Aphis craccivora]
VFLNGSHCRTSEIRLDVTIVQINDQSIQKYLKNILNSARSDECIDFTMMCVFFCLSPRFGAVQVLRFLNSAPKMNLVGTFGRSFVEIRNSFQKKSKKQKKKKNERKTGIFTKTQCLTKSIFLYGCTSKANHCKNLKFSPNVYVMSIKKFWTAKKTSEFNKKFIMIQICNISLRYLKILPFKYLQKFVKIMNICKLFCSVFRKLKHKPPFSSTTGNYILG